MKNFGQIKQYVTEQLSQSLLTEDIEKRKSFESFIKEIKKSDILKTQYKVYGNVENKFIKEESKAIRYINENLDLIKKFILKDYLNENKKLSDKFIIKENKEQCPCTLKLYENLDTLIKETISNNPDPEKKYESFNNVLEYIITEDTTKQEENYKFQNNTFFPTSRIIEMAINKFNNKYSFLNEQEKQIFTALFNNDQKGKELVFDKIKKENINQIKRKIVESDDEKLSDKLKLVEEKLSSMVYNEDNYIEDISKLNKLSLGF